MRILLDQSTPIGVREFLPGHIVVTAREQGWSALLNGELLRSADEAGFDVFLTADKSLVYQQNLSERSVAIVALGTNRWSIIKTMRDQIVSAVNAATPGSYALIEPATQR
jgi:hypothetical protein